jgi:flagellar M-ring protein FliF
MALLYADLELADASRIVARLEKQGIPIEIKAEGTQIYVPTNKVTRLRMDMAEVGLPKGRIVGYEHFDQKEINTSSSFMHDVKHLRALEGELARTISSLEAVMSARVHLVLPRRELFIKEQQQPSASIVLHMRSSKKLKQSKVLAIQHLVASAVPGLMPDAVAIIDDKGNLLASNDAEMDLQNQANIEEIRVAYETRTAQMIEGFVGKYVGADKVRAEVTAEIDVDRFSQEEERYDPQGQVERSRQIVRKSNEPHDMTEENIKYEVSKLVQKQSRESGSIRRLSVAVVVDGRYSHDLKGEEIYQPRSQEEMEQLKKLIASAIGFNAERKDQLEVINMPFAKVEKHQPRSVDYSEPIIAFKHSELLRFSELLIFIIATLLGIMIVIKPIGFNFSFKKEKSSTNKAPSQPHSSQMILNSSLDLKQSSEEFYKKILQQSSQKFTGAVKTKVSELSQQKIKYILDNHLEEAVSVLRVWLQEGK